MITVLSDNAVSGLGESISNELLSKDRLRHIILDDVDIKPCYSCGGCQEAKSFKRCVFRDDADVILPYIAQSERIIVVTPIVFGGYSYKTKLVIDKLALLGDFHYYVNKKEIVKGSGPPQMNYFAVGVTEKDDAKERHAFEYLVHETLLITNWKGAPVVCGPDCNVQKIIEDII